MKTNAFSIIVLIILIIPIIYLGFVFNSLPPQVATHFSINGEPDDYSSKETLVFLVTFLLATAIGVYLLLTNIQRIDPKRAAGQSKESMMKIGLAIVILISGIAIVIINSAINNAISLGKFMLPALGLFFAYLGNLMYSVKPNYFVGIRTPWTLEDEDTWRKTHQVAGKLWFAGGILITLITLIVAPEAGTIAMISIISIMTLIPVVYSYRYFKLHNR